LRDSFPDLECVLATRISLVRSVRQKEEREQIGNLLTPFSRALIDIEKKCLVRLSEAARAANEIQIALNSVIRAQSLDVNPSLEVSQEFANVLWLQNEEKLAVQYLKQLVRCHDADMTCDDESSTSKKALLLARLVSRTWNLCKLCLSCGITGNVDI
jgi:ataxia telangiectasia mutated family protein